MAAIDFPSTKFEDVDKSLDNLQQIKIDLITAQKQCYARRLSHAAKWAAEMSKSLTIKLSPKEFLNQDIADESDTFWEEYDSYVLAIGYFDLKEFARAAHCLNDCKSPKSYFLRMYSMYMTDQKQKADNISDSNAQDPIENETLKILQNDLSEAYLKKELDGYCLYLYGVVLGRLGLAGLAVEVLVEALHAKPLNWAAWLELARLITDKEMLTSLQLPQHWIRWLFQAKVYNELQLHEEALEIYKRFSQRGFEACPYVLAQCAVTYHDMRDNDEAINLFKLLSEVDPYRIENMDFYSNVLYIKENKSDLADLAHRCCTINKYCIETCCVIGNYYSIRSQHEKAILYFQRALKLNSNYIWAWTLMGHEYMSLKNTSAAIQAYRRAIEVDKRDFRAWYGLGQTYEILKMPSYSLYYYRTAQSLKPNDSRMILALGECYQKMERLQEAKKCYWKAHSLGDPEALALVKLANLYAMLQEKEPAFQAFSEYINITDELGIQHHEDLSQAYMYLATHHMEHRQWDQAYTAAHKCTEFTETREEAKAMLRTIQSARGPAPGEAASNASFNVTMDDSMDASAPPTLPGNQNDPNGPRPFGRVTPINLNFTP